MQGGSSGIDALREAESFPNSTIATNQKSALSTGIRSDEKLLPILSKYISCQYLQWAVNVIVSEELIKENNTEHSIYTFLEIVRL
jgi:hypothetical protein